jgi:EAL domain-containing protein (putative c-di-GMP-specific phosphodiesterase class I)
LKIDKSFVAVMLESETNTRLVQTIIDLAHGFGLRVVAEGVENAACADRLQALGCDTLQGYHFSKPLTQDEFLRYLAACRT